MIDIAVKVSYDEGQTWELATPENFHEEGIDVVIPYPEGSDRICYAYVVGHLMTSGDRAGEMEFPAVTETDDGIKIHITSASPFVIGWKVVASSTAPVVPTAAPTATAAPADTTTSTGSTTTSSSSTGTGSTSPKTYDDSVWFEEEKQPVAVQPEAPVQVEEVTKEENTTDYSDYTNVDVAIGAGKDIATGEAGLWLVVLGVMGVLAVAIGISASIYLKKGKDEA